jgi:hypothetical protein
MGEPDAPGLLRSHLQGHPGNVGGANPPEGGANPRRRRGPWKVQDAVRKATTPDGLIALMKYDGSRTAPGVERNALDGNRLNPKPDKTLVPFESCANPSLPV